MEKEFRAEPDGQMYFWSDIPTVIKDKEASGLYDIPSDDGGRFTLNMQKHSAAWGDVFIKMQDEHIDGNDWIYLPTVRLRSSVGGGMNPFITEAFGSILSYFSRGMQVLSETEKQRRERINPNSRFVVKKGEKDEPKISIIGIQDDDGNLKFIDIFLQQNGDVKLKVREQIQTRLEGTREESAGEMLFKTKENGGKNPFVNSTLTKLAERIAKAKRD